MRIVAGRFRGRRLAALGKGDAAAHLRPTPDRVRESLFSMLTHMGVVEGARVLDLFAGTGALGLEALSRGAVHATFVDKGRKAGSLIRENIRLTGTRDETRLLSFDTARLPMSESAPCDLVFLDPPYGQGLGATALSAAQAGGWIAPEAVIVWEEVAAEAAPDGFETVETRRFGNSVLTILRAGAQ